MTTIIILIIISVVVLCFYIKQELCWYRYKKEALKRFQQGCNKRSDTNMKKVIREDR